MQAKKYIQRKKLYTEEAIKKRNDYSLKYFGEPRIYIYNIRKLIIPEIYYYVWEKYMMLSYYNEVYCQNDTCTHQLDYDKNFFCMTMNEDKTFSFIESNENVKFDNVYPICEMCSIRIYRQKNGIYNWIG